MPINLTNTSRTLLTVELRSGDYLHLAPGETSGPLGEHEVHGNPRLDKLVERKAVAVAAVDTSSKASKPDKQAHPGRRDDAGRA
jgi:hypothetical protein